jgi:hypothetical protein
MVLYFGLLILGHTACKSMSANEERFLSPCFRGSHKQPAKNARRISAQSTSLSKFSEDCLKDFKEIFPASSHRFVNDLLLKVHLSLVR